MANNLTSSPSFLKGTTAKLAEITSPAGQVSVDTDKNVLVVHDGVTPGGHPLQPELPPISLLTLKADSTFVVTSDNTRCIPWYIVPEATIDNIFTLSDDGTEITCSRNAILLATLGLYLSSKGTYIGMRILRNSDTMNISSFRQEAPASSRGVTVGGCVVFPVSQGDIIKVSSQASGDNNTIIYSSSRFTLNTLR